MSDERLTRRALIAGAGAGGLGAALAAPVLAQKLIDLGLPGGPSLRPLEPAFPGKGEMIVQRIRPPLLETPMAAFREGGITPNDRFFVRWNWSMPTAINAAAHRVAIGGAVKAPVALALDELAQVVRNAHRVRPANNVFGVHARGVRQRGPGPGTDGIDGLAGVEPVERGAGERFAVGGIHGAPILTECPRQGPGLDALPRRPARPPRQPARRRRAARFARRRAWSIAAARGAIVRRGLTSGIQRAARAPRIHRGPPA
jgi:hypothetical protein